MPGRTTTSYDVGQGRQDAYASVFEQSFVRESLAAASALLHSARDREVPDPAHGTEVWEAGDRIVVGIDEVGRGSWAGPVTVAAVVPAEQHLSGIRDSKLLTPDEREVAARRVRGWARGIGVGHASHTECDELGMTEALRRAATRALCELAGQGFEPDRIVLDGKHDYLAMPDRVRTIVKADQSVLSVAAASVVAKVTRDALMADEAEHFPAYGFESNRGYPAPQHKCALAWLRAVVDPPAVVDLHGLLPLGRPPAVRASTAVPRLMARRRSGSGAERRPGRSNAEETVIEGRSSQPHQGGPGRAPAFVA